MNQDIQINGDSVIARLGAQIANLITQLAIKDNIIEQLEAKLAEKESEKNGSGPVEPAKLAERTPRPAG